MTDLQEICNTKFKKNYSNNSNPVNNESIEENCKHGKYDNFNPCMACKILQLGLLPDGGEWPQMKKYLEHLGVTTRFAHCNLANYITNTQDQKNVKMIVQNYVLDDMFIKEGFNLILCGSTGIGKTHLAVGIIKCLTSMPNTDWKVKMWKPHQLVDDIIRTKKSYQDYNEDDLLILDDLIELNEDKLQKKIISNILLDRYDQKLSTVITTNLSANELKEQLGDRLASRILGKNNLVYSFKSDDYRDK